MQEKLECWDVSPQKRAAGDLNRWKSLLEKIVVELPQRKPRSSFFSKSSRQLENLQFAQCVIKIGRICGPRLVSTKAPASVSYPSFYKESYRLIERHLPGVHLDARDIPGIA